MKPTCKPVLRALVPGSQPDTYSPPAMRVGRSDAPPPRGRQVGVPGAGPGADDHSVTPGPARDPLRVRVPGRLVQWSGASWVAGEYPPVSSRECLPRAR